MSRFFRPAGDSDSDTEESEEELMSSDDEAPIKPTPAAKPIGMSRFLKRGAGGGVSNSESSSDEDSDEDDSDEDSKGGESDEDSDDERKVVKSAAEKRIDEMVAVGKTIENALKINDWVAISNGMFIDPNLNLFNGFFGGG